MDLEKQVHRDGRRSGRGEGSHPVPSTTYRRRNMAKRKGMATTAVKVRVRGIGQLTSHRATTTTHQSPINTRCGMNPALR